MENIQKKLEEIKTQLNAIRERERERERERIIGLGSGRTTFPPQPKPFNEALNRLETNTGWFGIIISDYKPKENNLPEQPELKTLTNEQWSEFEKRGGELITDLPKLWELYFNLDQRFDNTLTQIENELNNLENETNQLIEKNEPLNREVARYAELEKSATEAFLENLQKIDELERENRDLKSDLEKKQTQTVKDYRTKNTKLERENKSLSSYVDGANKLINEEREKTTSAEKKLKTATSEWNSKKKKKTTWRGHSRKRPNYWRPRNQTSNFWTRN